MKMKAKKSIDRQMHEFAETTIDFLKKGDVEAAKASLQEAEQIYLNGTPEQKDAVVCVYLFYVSTFMEVHHCNIKGLFPENLLKEYYKQVNTTGI